MITSRKNISLTDFCRSIIKKVKTNMKQTNIKQKPDEFIKIENNHIPDVEAFNYSKSKDAEILKNRLKNI